MTNGTESDGSMGTIIVPGVGRTQEIAVALTVTIALDPAQGDRAIG